MHSHEHVSTEEAEECLIGCSTYKQYFTMRKRFENGPCAFCFVDRDINTILYGDDKGQQFYGWEVPKGFGAFGKALKLQFVFFPKRHVRHLNELTNEEREEYWRVVDWIYGRYEIVGGGFFSRVGDMRYNVGTVPHLHFNVWVPNREGEVLVPLQKNPQMRGEHEARALGFAARYEASEIPD